MNKVDNEATTFGLMRVNLNTALSLGTLNYIISSTRVNTCGIKHQHNDKFVQIVSFVTSIPPSQHVEHVLAIGLRRRFGCGCGGRRHSRIGAEILHYAPRPFLANWQSHREHGKFFTILCIWTISSQQCNWTNRTKWRVLRIQWHISTMLSGLIEFFFKTV